MATGAPLIPPTPPPQAFQAFHVFDDQGDDGDYFYLDYDPKQELLELQSEYAYELSQKSELRMCIEKNKIAIRRRNKILTYYDNYIFNYIYDVNVNDNDNYNKINKQFIETLEVEINKDYENILTIIRNEEFNRLQQEEKELDKMFSYQHSRRDTAYDDYYYNDLNKINQINDNYNHDVLNEDDDNDVIDPNIFKQKQIVIDNSKHIRRKSIEHRNQAIVLYSVSNIDKQKDKEWMKNLKTKKLKMFLNQKKYHRLQRQRIEYETQLQELQTKRSIQLKLTMVDKLQKDIMFIKERKIKYITHITNQINELNNTVAKLGVSNTRT